MARDTRIDVSVELIRETETLYLLEHEWSDQPVWIEKASCKLNETATVATIRENLAIAKGMV